MPTLAERRSPIDALLRSEIRQADFTRSIVTRRYRKKSIADNASSSSIILYSHRVLLHYATRGTNVGECDHSTFPSYTVSSSCSQ